MRIDMHVHSSHSPDGRASPREILARARELGLGGVAITDHNTMAGSREALELADDFGLIVIRGMEVSTRHGHLLAYGIDREIPRDLDIAGTVSEIGQQGGIAVVAHPYRPWSGMGEKLARRAGADALEVLNSHSTRRENVRARKLCQDMGLPMTAGSDAHDIGALGRAVTVVPEAGSEADVLDAIMSGRATVDGQDRTLAGALKDRAEIVVQWVSRGFRKM